MSGEKRILVVEDNPQNRKLVEDVLGPRGFRVTACADAEEGLAKAREVTPDLILMDVQLPGMDGLEATRLLKSDPATGGIPVIALTSFAMKGDAERILAAGFDSYISKPFHIRELTDKVDEMLDAAGRKADGETETVP